MTAEDYSTPKRKVRCSKEKVVKLTEAQALVLGARLRARRKQQGLTSYFLALAAGLPRSQVRRIEYGRSCTPPYRAVRVMTECLDMDMKELLEDVGDGV
jgi:hypothetical protein